METLGEMYGSQVGRCRLLLYAIEEMQRDAEKLRQNRPFLKSLLCMLTDAGVLKEERLEQTSKVVEDKLCLLERPYFLRDPDDPENWEKIVVFPVELFQKQAAAARGTYSTSSRLRRITKQQSESSIDIQGGFAMNVEWTYPPVSKPDFRGLTPLEGVKKFGHSGYFYALNALKNMDKFREDIPSKRRALQYAVDYIDQLEEDE